MRRQRSVELLRHGIVSSSSVDVFHAEEQKNPSETLIEGAQGMVCCIIEEGFGPWTMQAFDQHRAISVPKTVSDPENEEVVGGSVSWPICLLYEGPRRARQCSPAHDWSALRCVTRSLKQQTDRPPNLSANHFLMFRIGDCLGYRNNSVRVEILHRRRIESLFNYTTNHALGPLQ